MNLKIVVLGVALLLPAATTPAQTVPGEPRHDPGLAEIDPGGVTLDELPAPARNAVRRQIPDSLGIRSIQMQQWEGTVFEITTRDERKLQVAADGTVMNAAGSEGVGLVAGAQIEAAQLPGLVRNTLEEFLPAADIDDIRRGRWSGHIYQVDYLIEGRPQRFHVTDAGSVVRNAPTDHAVAGAASGRKGAAARANEDLPLAVQETLQQIAGDTPIHEIREGRIDGRSIYQASYIQGGERVDIVVDEEGFVIQERAGREEPGQAVVPSETPGAVRGTAQTGVAREPAGAVLPTQAEPVQETRGVMQTQMLPDPVVRTIYRQTGARQIAIVQPEQQQDGALVYRVAFMRGNISQEMLLSEAGTVIEHQAGPPMDEPAGAAPGTVAPEEMPPAVQRSLNALGAERIGSVRPISTPEFGVVYEIEMEQEGERGLIRVTADGFILPLPQ